MKCPLNSRLVALKMWSLDQCQHHLVTCQTCKFLVPIPDLLSQTPVICCLIRLAFSSLRATDIVFLKRCSLTCLSRAWPSIIDRESGIYSRTLKYLLIKGLPQVLTSQDYWGSPEWDNGYGRYDILAVYFSWIVLSPRIHFLYIFLIFHVSM